METKILPFKESIISYTPNMDHFLSVLENNHNLTFPWILENYIELIIRKDIWNPPVFEFLDYNKIWWTCPFVHVSRIARDAFAVYGGMEVAVRKLIDKDLSLCRLDKHMEEAMRKAALIKNLLIKARIRGSFAIICRTVYIRRI